MVAIIKIAVTFLTWLLVDSRVVHVVMAYHATCVRLSSLKPFFGTSLKDALRFSDNVGAEAPGSQ